MHVCTTSICRLLESARGLSQQFLGQQQEKVVQEPVQETPSVQCAGDKVLCRSCDVYRMPCGVLPVVLLDPISALYLQTAASFQQFTPIWQRCLWPDNRKTAINSQTTATSRTCTAHCERARAAHLTKALNLRPKQDYAIRWNGHVLVRKYIAA